MVNAQPTARSVADTRSLQQLRSFCRGELSAAESYAIALGAPVLRRHQQVLSACRDSHQKRARLLGREILRLGGEIPRFSGPWGALVDTIEQAAVALGPSAAIRALVQGEEHGLRDYRVDVDKLAPTPRQLVENVVMPAQVETYRAVSALK